MTPCETRLAHAREIATNPADHGPIARIEAWRALKAARGQDIRAETLPTVTHATAHTMARPDPAAPATLAEALDRLAPSVRRRVQARARFLDQLTGRDPATGGAA